MSGIWSIIGILNTRIVRIIWVAMAIRVLGFSSLYEDAHAASIIPYVFINFLGLGGLVKLRPPPAFPRLVKLLYDSFHGS